MAKSIVKVNFKKGDLIDGRYQVVKKLGEGGCGTVFRCKDRKLDDIDVAVKMLEDSTEMPRFRREAKVMKGTRSEHVVQLIKSGIHEKAHPYLALEFMDGGSIRELMDRRKRLEPPEAAWILIQAIRGLKASRTVHRDLKPENLLLAKGDKGRGFDLIPGDTDTGALVKVADFGLAKSRGGDSMSLTHSGQVMGTPLYMSPEQCRNTKRASVKTDIYAIGVIFFEMVTGKPPFDANNVYDIMAKHCNEEPKTGRLPKGAKEVIERCLKKKPGDRYPTLAALERELEEVAGLRSQDSLASGGGILFFIVFAILLAGGAVALYLFRDQIPFLPNH